MPRWDPSVCARVSVASRSYFIGAISEVYSPVVNSGHTYSRDVTLSASAKGNGFPPAPFTGRTRTDREGGWVRGKLNPCTEQSDLTRDTKGHFFFKPTIGHISPYKTTVFKYSSPSKITRNPSHVAGTGHLLGIHRECDRIGELSKPNVYCAKLHPAI